MQQDPPGSEGRGSEPRAQAPPHRQSASVHTPRKVLTLSPTAKLPRGSSMRHLIASLVFVLVAQAAHAAAPMTSGEYNDALLLAYDLGTGQVSGYFQMERGEQPSFSCIFYLQGKLAGSSAAISTWFPATPKDVIAGTLTLKDAAHVVVR